MHCTLCTFYGAPLSDYTVMSIGIYCAMDSYRDFIIAFGCLMHHVFHFHDATTAAAAVANGFFVLLSTFFSSFSPKNHLLAHSFWISNIISKQQFSFYFFFIFTLFIVGSETVGCTVFVRWIFPFAMIKTILICVPIVCISRLPIEWIGCYV